MIPVYVMICIKQ